MERLRTTWPMRPSPSVSTACAGRRSRRPPPTATDALQLGQRPAQAPHGLTDPLLVLDEREPNMRVSPRAEPHAWRRRDLRFRDEKLGELERPHLAVRLGDRRPDEHRALGLGD